MRNSYEGTLDDWKVELIRLRARAMKVPSNMQPDVEQELAMTLLGLTYIEGHKDGASERTFLTEVIDRRISSLLRKDRRYRSRVGEASGEGPPERAEVDKRLQQTEVATDVEQAMTRLAEFDRSICELLSEGLSPRAVADELNLAPATVRRRIGTIRQQLRVLGLEKWVHTRDESVGKSAELISAREAAGLCGRSERAWRTWDAAGLIPQPVRIGRSTMWRRDELHAWIKAGCPRREEWEIVSQNRA